MNKKRPSNAIFHSTFIAAIAAGMILGALLGGFSQREFSVVTLIGERWELFLSALKMMIIPLIFFSNVCISRQRHKSDCPVG
ncbi:MAG: cation:dicarboxylase symporter family transporter [Deltaproteobacteria bacterium]|nr:cation:dicarboxylase symporter family transporter [Deltaproteobacteria bacterium]MBN2673988.1 cation:dicarboxylase symporter family transporter [Deltaproteobacteria bacterium]